MPVGGAARARGVLAYDFSDLPKWGRDLGKSDDFGKSLK